MPPRKRPPDTKRLSQFGRSQAETHTHTHIVTDFEAEVLPGLEPFAQAELKGVSGVQQVRLGEGAVGFRFVGNPAKLADLRTVVAVYQTLHFAVPRPKALLGHEQLSRLRETIATLGGRQTFKSFRLSAAGSDSVVYTRFTEMLSQETGLPHLPDEGDLLVRVRRVQTGGGWDVLLRLTPRPLSVRSWRVCNLAGGLNATLAAAMLKLADIQPGERVFNPMCGSGTLLLEQGPVSPARLLGCDLNPAALACSLQNVQAAGREIDLFEADATATGLEPGSVDVIVTDPPWGDAVGSHTGNAALYPALLAELSRIAAPGVRLVLLTHELRLFEQVLSAQDFWQVGQQFRVFHGGHYPHIYLLTKRPA